MYNYYYVYILLIIEYPFIYNTITLIMHWITKNDKIIYSEG